MITIDEVRAELRVPSNTWRAYGQSAPSTIELSHALGAPSKSSTNTIS